MIDDFILELAALAVLVVLVVLVVSLLLLLPSKLFSSFFTSASILLVLLLLIEERMLDPRLLEAMSSIFFFASLMRDVLGLPLLEESEEADVESEVEAPSLLPSEEVDVPSEEVDVLPLLLESPPPWLEHKFCTAGHITSVGAEEA